MKNTFYILFFLIISSIIVYSDSNHEINISGNWSFNFEFLNDYFQQWKNKSEQGQAIGNFKNENDKVEMQEHLKKFKFKIEDRKNFIIIKTFYDNKLEEGEETFKITKRDNTLIKCLEKYDSKFDDDIAVIKIVAKDKIELSYPKKFTFFLKKEKIAKN